MNQTETANIRDWYVQAYPKDCLGQEIPVEWTFPELWAAFYAPHKTKKQLSILLDWDDSVIRERVFSEMAARGHVGYDELYERWISAADEKQDAEENTKQMNRVISNAAVDFMKSQAENLIGALDDVLDDCPERACGIVEKAQGFIRWLADGAASNAIPTKPGSAKEILDCSDAVERLARENNFYSDQLETLDSVGSMLFFLGSALLGEKE